MENIRKLLKISSSPIKDNSPEKDKISSRGLYDLLKHKNGFYAFESSLHVFSDDELIEINNFIKRNNLFDRIEGCIYFAEDIFGNLFCLKNGKVYLLDVESEKLEYISESIEDWAGEILKDYNYLTGYPLAHEWQIKNGGIDYGKRLVPKKLFILGGDYNIDNLEAKNRFKSLQFRSDISRQIRDLTDGEEVLIDYCKH